MVKNHLKRLATPRTWGIERKELKFVTRPLPGAHSFRLGLPLTVVLKDLLKVAKTNKEITRIIHHKELFVDMKPVKDIHSMIGLFDLVSFPKTNISNRIVLNDKGKLDIINIEEKESNLKITRINNKSLVKGKVQLNCEDGRNILVEKDSYKTGDTIVIDLPGQNIKEHIKMDKGILVFLIGGKHIGDYGKVEKIEGDKLTFKSSKGKSFETLKKYAFVIGNDKPAIKMIKEIKK